MTASPRLGAATLSCLPADVARPAYPAAAATIGVVHLGVGNFFRAHQAIYLDEAMARGAAGWGICGVSLRSPVTRNALAPQDGYYAVAELDGTQSRLRIVGSLRELLVAPEEPQRVVERIAAPDTCWVTLTVTEKGYGLEPDHPDLEHDRRHPDRPRSAVGLLHAAALRRRDRGLPGITVASCDNLAGNGHTLRRLLLEYDTAIGAGAAGWIEASLRFPNSMVDRIVPRTTDDDRGRIRAALGVEDAWPVLTEPFSQWVLEEDFAGPRPPLEASGARVVRDVRPHEAMKLRLLNAAHSALAWLAVPAGIETVERAVSEPGLRRFVERLWQDEAIPGLDAEHPEIGQEAPGYCHDLLLRFANPGLAHRTAQIAMDGSQKLPLRILPSIRRNLAEGLPIDRLALVVAAWVRYLHGIGERGEDHAVDDPAAGRLRQLAANPNGRDAIAAVMADSAIFGDLAAEPRLQAAAADGLERLRRAGSLAVVAGMS
ncbi:MAG: mannitol dehydrogenase family protein [Burkholderiaceae bacterium]|nr:mannitol dehydrogenase family protein [Burkholderiaceae bacterium]